MEPPAWQRRVGRDCGCCLSGPQGVAGLGTSVQAPALIYRQAGLPHTTPSARLPAAGSTSESTVKSMTRDVKSKAVCWPLCTTEMQWRSP